MKVFFNYDYENAAITYLYTEQGLFQKKIELLDFNSTQENTIRRSRVYMITSIDFKKPQRTRKPCAVCYHFDECSELSNEFIEIILCRTIKIPALFSCN